MADMRSRKADRGNGVRENQRGLTILELLIAMFILSLLAVVGMPAYQDYRVRAEVATDFPLVNIAKQAIEEYYAVKGTLPAGNADVGLEQYFSFSPDGPKMKMLIYNSWASGGSEPTILLMWNSDEIPALKSWETIEFRASEENGLLTWECTQGSMPNKYRPPNCRR